MGTTHGMSKTRLYRMWAGIKSRCMNESNTAWKAYGGRGIRMCEEWANDFISFKEWAEQNGYSDDLQIDRIDVNGDYSPLNCRFASPMQNSNNRRNSKFISINGKKKTIRDVCNETGLSYATISGRLNSGWDVEQIRDTPPLKKRKFYDTDTNGFRSKITEIRNKKGMSKTEFAKLSGFSRQEISMIENGRNDPTISTITRLASALGVHISDLFPRIRTENTDENEKLLIGVFE